VSGADVDIKFAGASPRDILRGAGDDERKMKPMTVSHRAFHTVKGLIVPILVCFILVGSAHAAAADDARDAARLVEQARLAFEGFIADKNMGPALASLLQRARGVLIYPQVLRGAFIIGASGGSGVLLSRDAHANRWGGPAFYTIGEASFGLQAGGDASEVVLVALTDRGMTSLLATSAKLGADAGVAVGPVGAGAEAATANLSADIISYSRAKGLYAGISVEGAVVASRAALNRAYYGADVSPTDILIRRTVTNPHAAGLIGAVRKAVAGK
jgi:lipid-binding SYLF domain-containing protein